MLVHLDQGRAMRLEGDPDHPVTRGFLCGKVAQYLDRQYNPDRLLYPMKRAGAKGEGRFTRISWDEALDTIATRLAAITREHGSEAILPYSYYGNMGILNAAGMDRRFFHRAGASRLDRTICSSAGSAGLVAALGVRYGTEPEQYAKSKLILGWGANVHGTHIHTWPFIVEARRHGAQLIVIDPVRTRTAKLADRHFFINPGSDLALALAMMHVIIEEKLYDADYVERHTTGFAGLAQTVKRYTPQVASEFTGIPADEIAWLARTYATTRPAVIRTNYGISRSERGGRAMQAVAYLPVLTGSWREEGGGFTLSTGGAFAFNADALERPDLQGAQPKRLVNMSLLGEALNNLADPPVKALICYNSNPAAVAPNANAVLRGLAREDLFTVTLEQFQTDTADYADVVLPVTTFLENTDLYRSYGHYYVQLARPAVDAPGECKSNFWIFRELARRMGFDDSCFQGSEEDMIREALSSGSKFLEGITLERLDAERSIRLNLGEGPFLPHAEGGFGTASGKCEFDAAALEYTPPMESRQGDKALAARYPLELVSSKNDNSMNSTFGNRTATDAETGRAYLHAEDAQARGIRTGDQIRVFNDRGSLRIEARVDGQVAPGVIRIPGVRWPKHAPDRQGVNALTPERLTDIGNGAVFFSCLVQAERCGD